MQIEKTRMRDDASRRRPRWFLSNQKKKKEWKNRVILLFPLMSKDLSFRATWDVYVRGEEEETIMANEVELREYRYK